MIVIFNEMKRSSYTDPVKITVNNVSPQTLSVSWVESATGAASHLPTDTYTITATPSCRDGQTGFTSPAPQTVSYTDTPSVTIPNLGK